MFRRVSSSVFAVGVSRRFNGGATVSKEELPADPFTSKVAGTLRGKIYAKDYKAAGLTEKEEQIITEWRNPVIHPSKARSTQPDDLGNVMGEATEGSEDVAAKYGGMFRDQRPLDPNETADNKRRRLIFQSRYRGMVEMDLIFGHFARCKLESLDKELLDEYDHLLKQLDNDLFRWLVTGQKATDEIEAMRCYQILKQFVQDEREELLGHY